MSTRRLLIIGAGGFGREVLSWARQSRAYERDWTIKGFLDDNIDALRGFGTAAEMVGRVCDYEPLAEDLFVCAIGRPALRRSIQEQLSARGGEFTNIVHPTVVFSDNVTLGSGLVLCPYVVISANATLRDGVAVNLHSSVDHDAVVGAWSQINCHCDVTGGVILDEEVFMGSHASILPGVRVGRGAVIGAGAVVRDTVKAGTTVVGVPARPIHQG